MKTSTVNIAFQRDLLTQVDDAAKEESRSRSELIREAARMYIERKKKWKDIFAFGQSQSRRRGLKEEDIEKEILAYREKKGPRPT